MRFGRSVEPDFIFFGLEYTCDFGESDWVHQGFELDDEVLGKLYYENPKKVMGF